MALQPGRRRFLGGLLSLAVLPQAHAAQGFAPLERAVETARRARLTLLLQPSADASRGMLAAVQGLRDAGIVQADMRRVLKLAFLLARRDAALIARG